MQAHKQIDAGQKSLRIVSAGSGLFLTLMCILFLWNSPVVGQPINRRSVNKLVAQLTSHQPDSSRLITLVELGKFHLYKPGEAKKDLDSASMYFSQAKQLSNALHLVTWQHDIEGLFVIVDMEGGNNQRGRLRFAQLIKECRRTGDTETEANARSRMAVWLRNSDHNYHDVFAHFRQAAAMYKAINNQEKEIYSLQEIAVTHLYQGQLDSAETGLINVLNRYKAIHYPKLHYTYNLLSSVGTLKGDYDKGLLYAMLCIDSMNKTADTLSAASFYGDLARIYVELGNHQKGVDWYKKSLAKWRQEKQPNFALFSAAGFLAKDLIGQKKPQDALRLIQNLVQEIPTNTIIQKACVAQNLAYCYDALGNYRLAEQYYKETLDWYAKNKMDFEASQQAEQDIGVFYFKQKNFSQARDHLTRALRFFPQKNSLSTIKDIHLLLFKVDSAQGNYLSAIDHFRQHKALNDSLFSETKSRQIATLQIQYDTHKKEQNISLLTKQSKLQQIELEHEKTTRNGIIVGTILLAGLLGVSYNQYRLKRRSNQLLEAKQIEINQKNQSLEQVLGEKEELLTEKEWMLKEIHHRVKNNLQVITSLLNAQSDFLHDSTALAAIRESQNRVHAMALIHQKLYQSDNLARVSMPDYIDEIVAHLLESFSHQDLVREVITVAPIQLDVNLATPIGLIINEAVTNSLKYAFPHQEPSNNDPATIQVSLQPVDEQLYRLTISDNGIGMPAGLDYERSNTLGLTMIRGLSRQIGGQLLISQDEGVHICLEFDTVKKANRTGRGTI